MSFEPLIIATVSLKCSSSNTAPLINRELEYEFIITPN